MRVEALRNPPIWDSTSGLDLIRILSFGCSTYPPTVQSLGAFAQVAAELGLMETTQAGGPIG